VRAKAVLEDLGAGENGAKTQVAQEYFLALPKVKCL